MNEPTKILCGRVGDPHVTLIPGMVTVKCDQCEAAVWLSPASQALRERLKCVGVVCLQCAAPIRNKKLFTTKKHEEEARAALRSIKRRAYERN